MVMDDPLFNELTARIKLLEADARTLRERDAQLVAALREAQADLRAVAASGVSRAERAALRIDLTFRALGEG
jgi:hypothetical protein